MSGLHYFPNESILTYSYSDFLLQKFLRFCSMCLI